MDDNADLRSTSADVLSLAGHEVATAASGDEALALMDGGLVPDAILLDLLMPGMDGATLLEKLRARPGPRPRVVVVSGLRSRDLKRLLGVDAVLEKPVDPSEIVAALGRPAS